MHEMALAESVLQVIEAAARSEQFARVKAVSLEVGRMAGVEIEALRFCFDVVCRDSIAAGAALKVVDAPGSGWCLMCCRTVEVDALFAPCPDCGSYQVQVTGGTEMRIKELEVD